MLFTANCNEMAKMQKERPGMVQFKTQWLAVWAERWFSIYQNFKSLEVLIRILTFKKQPQS